MTSTRSNDRRGRLVFNLCPSVKNPTGNIHARYVGTVLKKVLNLFAAINVTYGSTLNALISPYPDSDTLALKKTEMYLFIVQNAGLLLIVPLNAP